MLSSFNTELDNWLLVIKVLQILYNANCLRWKTFVVFADVYSGKMRRGKILTDADFSNI